MKIEHLSALFIFLFSILAFTASAFAYTCGDSGLCGSYPNCISCSYSTYTTPTYTSYTTCGDLGQCGSYPNCQDCSYVTPTYYSSPTYTTYTSTCGDSGLCGSYPNCISCSYSTYTTPTYTSYTTCGDLGQCGSYPNCYSCSSYYYTTNYNPAYYYDGRVYYPAYYYTGGSYYPAYYYNGGYYYYTGGSYYPVQYYNGIYYYSGGTYYYPSYSTSYYPVYYYAGGYYYPAYSTTYSNYPSYTSYSTYPTYPTYPSCSYALSISPNSGSYTDSDRSWYISATDSSSGCASPIAYSVSYSLSGDCSSSTSVSPTSFTISPGSTLSNAITARVVRGTNACTLSLTVRSPSGSTVASASYTLNPSSACIGRYLDSYICSGNNRQQLYQNSDCTTYWVTTEYSSSYCLSGQTVSYASAYATPTYYTPTYVLPSDDPKEIEVARNPSEIETIDQLKAQVFSQTTVSSSGGSTAILILFLVLGIAGLSVLSIKFKGGFKPRSGCESFQSAKSEDKLFVLPIKLKSRNCGEESF